MNTRLLFPLGLLVVAGTSADPAAQAQTGGLTLDPERYAEALREVQGMPQSAPVASSKPAAAASPSGTTAPTVEDWQAAMRDAGTELADVRLLVLLQRLNPQAPPSARAEDYAEVLRLHHLVLAGNARACLTLARACQEGRFENGLLFLRNEDLADVLRFRAASFQLPIEVEEFPGL